MDLSILTNAGDRLTWLRADKAGPIALKAQSRMKSFARDIAGAIVDGGTITAEENTLIPRANGRFTTNRGLILDLPNLFFDTPTFRHRVGISLTVCMPTTRSKIWFRSQCVGWRDGGDFGPATGMKFEDLTAFFAEATAMSTPALGMLMARYHDMVEAELAIDHAIADLSLTPAKEFRVKVFDSNREDLSTVLDRLESGERYTQYLSFAAATQGTEPHPAILAARMNVDGAPEGRALIDTILEQRGKYSAVGQTNRLNDIGLFLRREEPSDGGRTDVDVSGVAFDRDATANDRSVTSPGLRLTADMLAGMVREFDKQAA